MKTPPIVTFAIAAILAADLEFFVMHAAALPASGEFLVLVDSEVMRVTAVTGNKLTVIRGVEGTTAADHAAGVPISYSAQDFTEILASIRRGAGVVALTDGTTIATDASRGDTFSVTLAGNRTLSNPTNAVDGQILRWHITQDGTGSRTLALGNKFTGGGGAGITTTLSTAASSLDTITAQYILAIDKFKVLSFSKGS